MQTPWPSFGHSPSASGPPQALGPTRDLCPTSGGRLDACPGGRPRSLFVLFTQSSGLHLNRHSSLAIESRSSHVSQAIFKIPPRAPQSKSTAGPRHRSRVLPASARQPGQRGGCPRTPRDRTAPRPRREDSSQDPGGAGGGRPPDPGDPPPPEIPGGAASPPPASFLAWRALPSTLSQGKAVLSASLQSPFPGLTMALCPPLWRIRPEPSSLVGKGP